MRNQRVDMNALLVTTGDARKRRSKAISAHVRRNRVEITVISVSLFAHSCLQIQDPR